MDFYLGGEREKQKSFQTSIHPLSQFLYCPAGPRKASNYCYGHILWKEVTPGALQGENPPEAEYSDMMEHPKNLQAAHIFCLFLNA